MFFFFYQQEENFITSKDIYNLNMYLPIDSMSFTHNSSWKWYRNMIHNAHKEQFIYNIWLTSTYIDFAYTHVKKMFFQSYLLLLTEVFVRLVGDFLWLLIFVRTCSHLVFPFCFPVSFFSVFCLYLWLIFLASLLFFFFFAIKVTEMLITKIRARTQLYFPDTEKVMGTL